MKKIIIIILFLILCGCSKAEKITKFDLDSIISDNNYVIVDVRTKEEYDELHVEGAINIPYDLIDENIEIEKDKVILVYCRSGNRSHIAFEKFKNIGFEVYDLKGINDIELPKISTK